MKLQKQTTKSIYAQNNLKAHLTLLRKLLISFLYFTINTFSASTHHSREPTSKVEAQLLKKFPHILDLPERPPEFLTLQKNAEKLNKMFEEHPNKSCEEIKLVKYYLMHYKFLLLQEFTIFELIKEYSIDFAPNRLNLRESDTSAALEQIKQKQTVIKAELVARNAGLEAASSGEEDEETEKQILELEDKIRKFETDLDNLNLILKYLLNIPNTKIKLDTVNIEYAQNNLTNYEESLSETAIEIKKNFKTIDEYKTESEEQFKQLMHEFKNSLNSSNGSIKEYQDYLDSLLERIKAHNIKFLGFKKLVLAKSRINIILAKQEQEIKTLFEAIQVKKIEEKIEKNTKRLFDSFGEYISKNPHRQDDQELVRFLNKLSSRGPLPIEEEEKNKKILKDAIAWLKFEEEEQREFLESIETWKKREKAGEIRVQIDFKKYGLDVSDEESSISDYSGENTVEYEATPNEIEGFLTLEKHMVDGQKRLWNILELVGVLETIFENIRSENFYKLKSKEGNPVTGGVSMLSGIVVEELEDFGKVGMKEWIETEFKNGRLMEMKRYIELSKYSRIIRGDGNVRKLRELEEDLD